MKKLYLFLFLNLIFFVHVIAQKKTFIRIYPIGSPKVIRGLYAGHSDSAIIITNSNQRDTINYLNIQYIKTRRTTGHHILISAVLGAAAGAITGLVTTHKKDDITTPDPNCPLCPVFNYVFSFTPAEAAEGGALLGGTTGAAVGAIIGLTNKKETINVNGDFQSWKRIIPKMELWPADMRNSVIAE